MAAALFCPVYIARAQMDKNEAHNNADDGDNHKSKNAEPVIRPGMELRKVGGLNLIVPEGSEIYKDRGRWVMEEPEAFAARNFKEIKSRLDKLEKENQSLKDEVEKLKMSATPSTK